MTLGNLVTKPCVFVSKRFEVSKDGSKKFYRIGIVGDDSVTGELSVSEEIYNAMDDDMRYKPFIFVVTYHDSQKFGSYLSVDSFRPYNEPASANASKGK